MQRRGRDGIQKRLLEEMMKKLKEGIVIVEGKHDVDTLHRLGIDSIAYAKFVGSNRDTREFHTKKTFYVVMDNDKGGDEKEQKILDILISMDNDIVYDTTLGKRFLRLLGITSVEQAYGMVEQIMLKAE